MIDNYKNIIEKLVYEVESFKLSLNIIEKLVTGVTETTERKNMELAEGIYGISEKSEESSKQVYNFLKEVVRGEDSLIVESKKLLQSIDSLTEIRKGYEEAITNLNERASKLESTMRDIDKYSENITDIAEITSILAINASIEAARAGKHGKGFKVIAKEIHSLASRSKGVSGKIREMIDEMIKYSIDYLFQYVRELKESLVTVRHVNEQLILIAEKIDDYTKLIETSLMETKELSDSLQGNVKRVTNSLQLQDITRQQIENILKILKNLKSNFDSVLQKIDFKVSIDMNKLEKRVHEMAGYSFTVADEYKTIDMVVEKDVEGRNNELIDGELKGDITLF